MQPIVKSALLGSSFMVFVCTCNTTLMADSISEAITNGNAYGDFRLRYESVDQDNTVNDASALTLRSRLGYNTGTVEGFSATVEFEDSRVVAGQDEFTVGPSGVNLGQYSVIADPETTELDQAYLRYKTDTTTTKLGRQVITFDNHRFIGHVGWRQDRQTFDAISTQINPVKDLTVHYAYLDKRNRIFAEDADIDSKDHLINIAYKTPVGKLVGYAYLLEMDTNVENSLDTYGMRFSGATSAANVTIVYTVELATQEFENGNTEFDADYLMLEGGVTVHGITVKAGYEILGSDDGGFGFSTPLATMFKFNGWTDQFLATPANGLKDASLTVSGELAGGKWSAAYHDFKADEKFNNIDDFGDEFNITYAKKFGKNYNAGIKYATYSAGDTKVDTDKMWVWVGLTF